MVLAIPPAVNNALFWIAAAVCVVAQLALLWSAIRAPMAGSSQSETMKMPSRASEIGWTIVPAIGLAVLLVFSWRAIARHETAASDPHAGHRMIDE